VGIYVTQNHHVKGWIGGCGDAIAKVQTSLCKQCRKAKQEIFKNEALVKSNKMNFSGF
jgi:hypothetical protein